jgi:hypothetical protein
VLRFLIYRHWVFRRRQAAPAGATILSFPASTNGHHS